MSETSEQLPRGWVLLHPTDGGLWIIRAIDIVQVEERPQDDGTWQCVVTTKHDDGYVAEDSAEVFRLMLDAGNRMRAQGV